MLYNVISTMGACTDKMLREQVVEDSMLHEAIKNGRMFVSSLNTDGYFYQGAYSLTDYIVEVPDEEYPLLLTTTRLLFHYHAAMTRRCKTLDNEVKTGYIEISETDAKEIGIIDKEIVRASSRRGTIDIPARVTKDIKPGVVNIPMHFTECAANVLTNSDSFDPKCKMVELKACAIKVEKIEE